MLSVQYAIQSIQYLIHTLSDSYVTQSIRYPFHMLSNQLRFIAFIIFNAVFRCPQPKHSPYWLFYSSIKFSVVLSHIQIVFLIMYPIHMLYNPDAIWSIHYLIHTLSDSYAIWSICYLIYTLSDPYAIQSLRYLIHTLSVPYAIWSIRYLIHIYPIHTL